MYIQKKNIFGQNYTTFSIATFILTCYTYHILKKSYLVYVRKDKHDNIIFAVHFQYLSNHHFHRRYCRKNF